MKLSDSVTAFLIEQQVRGNTAKTVRYYALCLELFSRFVGADSELESLTVGALKSYYIFLVGRGISSVSAQSYMRGVRAFCTWCFQEEFLPVDLSAKFRLPKAQRKTVDVLTDTEVRILMSCFSLRNTVQLRNACICSLMLDCGLRLHEVVSLTLNHLHIADGYAIVDGKGNKQRIVPLGNYSRKLLLRYLARRPAAVICPAVFLQRDLSPVTDNTLRLMFRRLKVQAGIPRLRAHLLRHTFATGFLQQGGDMYTLQQILGHTSLEMVKRYVHFTPAKLQSNHAKYSPLDRLLK